MQLAKIRLESGAIRLGVVESGQVRLLRERSDARTLSDVLHADDPGGLVRNLLDETGPRLDLTQATLLAPLDRQEVWAAGVTYKRSKEERERESQGAAHFYDLVYSAPRPELFFKALAARVVGPGSSVRIRHDSRWNVPEPELALVVSPRMRIVGFTIGNDMSSRDIEGENPLYLPQAKVYDGSCAVGPVITLVEAMPPVERITIGLRIERRGTKVFEGSTPLSQMKRSFEELVDWLGRENTFRDGAVLLTGTGIVPPDDFTLAVGDVVSIEITGIGRLVNEVAG
jgi:2-dehydro-3-deoxy-D-arabinonate dehydratase